MIQRQLKKKKETVRCWIVERSHNGMFCRMSFVMLILKLSTTGFPFSCQSNAPPDHYVIEQGFEQQTKKHICWFFFFPSHLGDWLFCSWHREECIHTLWIQTPTPNQSCTGLNQWYRHLRSSTTHKELAVKLWRTMIKLPSQQSCLLCFY